MAALSTFPASDLDVPESLKVFLGGFWSSVCEDQVEIDAFHDALASAWRQVARDAETIAASGSILTTPSRRVVEWARVTAESDAKSQTPLAGLRYGESARFGDSFRFGGLKRIDEFPISIAPWSTAAGIFDSQTRTTVAWIRDADFRIDERNQIIWLPADPFRDPRLRTTPRFNDLGESTGSTIDLWLWRAERDERWLWRRHGYAVGIDSPSTENGRRLVAAVYDAISAGTSLDAIATVLSAVLDAPICESDGELVELIGRDRQGGFVATNRRIYRFGDGASPVVAPEQRLRRGDPLTDAFRIDEIRGGQLPADAPGVVIPGPAGPILAINADSPIRFNHQEPS